MKCKPQVKYKGRVYEAVSLEGLCPEMMEVLPIIDKAYIHEGYEAVCTSGTEWFYSFEGLNCFIHSLGSDHYKKRAVDISCRDIPAETCIAIQNEMQQKMDLLRPGYYILYHGDLKHFHIGYRPKK